MLVIFDLDEYYLLNDIINEVQCWANREDTDDLKKEIDRILQSYKY